MKYIVAFLLILFFIVPAAKSQEKKASLTDVSAPLHALQPDYPVPYGKITPESVTEVLNRIYNYLDEATPAGVEEKESGKEIRDLKKLTPDADFKQGSFRLISYEWGVVYGAMLKAGEVTGDKKFTEYTLKRTDLIAGMTKYFKSVPPEKLKINPVRSVLDPRALDDAGSMCAAMIKTYEANKNQDLLPMIDNYIRYISEKQFRLSDGTLARNRPLPNTLWLDDLYMSVPALARMGKLSGDSKYFDDAVKQVLQFSERMFSSGNGLFMHGWVERMNPHPEFYWARCNGWALLAMTELLDVLPEGHKGYNEVLRILQAHIKGLARYQSGSGLWHQLIDKTDSYLETSSTAIFTYCIAHSINKGWIDAQAYGPVAVLGWNALQTKVNKTGQVEGTCVGTGMAFDPAFYYHRPVNVFAAHGYGPVILAGAEMIKLISGYQIEINDSAVMFYKPGTEWQKFR
ncbi:MAG: glycoside hydrolase family 88 protein [Bacteroidales bacterium]|nr:glycoside hydrolase family 88 protein [Bacteroidales bacterium]